MGAFALAAQAQPAASTRVATAPDPSALVASNGAAGPRPDPRRLDYGLQARALAPGVYVVEGSNADFSPANGCNIINTGFLVGSDGVLVINTGPSRRYGEALRALIARTTPLPVREVIHLNLHPDYFLGNQAFADVPRLATPATRAGMAREAKAYEDNLYRLCGDWMAGTEALLPDTDLVLPGTEEAGKNAGKAVHEERGLDRRFGGRALRLLPASGHTDADLVLIDEHSGIAFAGGLVFAQRIPTTPHADLPRWLASLDRLQDLAPRGIVPSHGPVDAGLAGLEQTRAYLRWLDEHFARWAREGREMNEVLRMPLPAPFAGWAARETEYVRNVAHLYPRYEQQVLPAAATTPR